MVAIKKLQCVCGHSFMRKPHVTGYSPMKSKRIAIHQKRALESAVETVLRQVKDGTRKAQKRALETHDESLYRQEQTRLHKRENQKL